MAKQYNPYNAIKNIVGYKGDYHNEQSFGRDPNAAHQSALPYYKELVDNGYESLAQQLSELDYTGAKKLLGNYKPDNEFNLDNDYANLTGEGGTANAAVPTAQNNAMSAADIISAPHPNDSSISNLMNLGTGITGMAQGAYDTAQGIATGATPIQPSAATQGLLDNYNRDYERLNGAIQYDAEGNVVSGLNTSHYNTGRQQLDYYNNFDITKQPYYQGIMDAYNLGGYNAAQGEYANGAANNSGNIDSYAAANANRQQLAFTTAGMQQAMAMAQQNANNWNSLYSQMSNDLYNQGALSLETLKVAKDMYAKDADERMNALDVQSALASDQMANAITAFEKLVQERMDDKGISAEQALKEMDIANEQKKLEMEIARDLEQSNIESRTRQYESDNTLKGTMYESDNNLAGTLDTNAKNLQGTMYKADTDLAGTQVKAQADMFSADRKAQADEYGSLLGYQGTVYSADRGLDKVYAQSAADQAQAEYENQLQRDYAQWLIDNGYTPTGAETSQSKAMAELLKTGGDGQGETATVDGAIDEIRSLYNEGNIGVMKSAGMGGIKDNNTFAQWVRSTYGLSNADSEKVVDAIAGKNGYANFYDNLQGAIAGYSEYGSKDKNKPGVERPRPVMN